MRCKGQSLYSRAFSFLLPVFCKQTSVVLLFPPSFRVGPKSSEIRGSKCSGHRAAGVFLVSLLWLSPAPAWCALRFDKGIMEMQECKPVCCPIWCRQLNSPGCLSLRSGAVELKGFPRVRLVLCSLSAALSGRVLASHK